MTEFENIFKYEDVVTKTLSQQSCEDIAEHINNLIEEFSINKYPAEHREHLGASIIGEPCSRKSWYSFRWVKLEQHQGRIRRLFNRGFKEEIQFIEMLRAIGLEVWEVDPETQKQFKIYGVKGHFGGSADSIAKMPWLKDLPILLEFKTHNTKSFVHLTDKKLILSKPKHFAQMSCYAYKLKIRYGLYIAVNKNDDDIYIEFIELDWKLGFQMENKAQDIIESKFPPTKISENPSYFECKYCNFNEICHYKANVEKNCRSCKMSIPIENGQWFCSRFNNVIPLDFIPRGCNDHLSINE